MEEMTAIHRDAPDGSRGRLKIFFGYAAGVGKTYAMLQAAQRAKERGIDVVVGCVESHARPRTAELLDGLERLPAHWVTRGRISAREFDLDAALARHPQLILVDELAHANAGGSRHAKRYQDVQELLNAGIDVYTSVDVAHIESLNDTVASITGAAVEERIPDTVFDRADQVELVDIEPAELLERLPGGEARFFEEDNLIALRELALRRCADRIKLRMERARPRSQSGYHTDEHILVCLSPSPSNAKIIRTGARMAQAFRGTFTALYVETPATARLDAQDRARLRENVRLAEQLGAAVETSYGDDVPSQIAEFARISGVSRIVIGRSTAARRSLFGKPTLTDRLIDSAPNLDIHVIPDASAEGGYRARRRGGIRVRELSLRDILKSLMMMVMATLVSCGFDALGFTESNIIAIYVLGVLIVSVITTNRLCGLLASVASVMIFNFFFTVPRFTFRFDDPDYLVTLPVMFMVTLLAGSLANRLKDSAKQSARAAHRTRILFETNQLLQKGRDEQSVVDAAAGQLMKLLERDLVVYLSEGGKLSAPRAFRTSDSARDDLVSGVEGEAALWVLRNNKHAGATTDTLSGARCLYLAIRVNQRVYGVVGIAMNEIPLDTFEKSVLLSILGECALALENIKNAREKEEAAVLAENERLRANLLRAISHDLRTPLTSISGNADNLMANYSRMDDATRAQTFADIYDDSMWLIDLVENLLAITRIEGGDVRLTQSVELMDEIIAEALRHVSRKGSEHAIRVSASQDLLLAYVDAKLIVQVVINLVNNAIKYTPAGSGIEIHTQQRERWIVVSVSDDGPGIPDAQKPRIFDMFYSGANQIADSRRSLGLGLALCKSIVTAHGGRIWVEDRQPRGAVFTFTLPAGEVELHE